MLMETYDEFIMKDTRECPYTYEKNTITSDCFPSGSKLVFETKPMTFQDKFNIIS